MPALVTRRAAIAVVLGLVVFAASFGVGRAGESEPRRPALEPAKAPAVQELGTPRALPPLARTPARKRRRATKRTRVRRAAPAPRIEPQIAPQPAPVPAPRVAPAPKPAPTPAPTPAPSGGFDDSG